MSEETTDLTEEEKQNFKDQLGPILKDVAISGSLAAISGIALQMIVTNYSRKELVGDVEAKPTDNETTVNKAEVAGNEAEGKLAKDGVNGAEGKIKANETKGIAATAEATAADTGAQALQTKAGAMDVKTKALEIQ